MKKIILLLLICAGLVDAQFTTLWERNSRIGAIDVKPSWFGSGTERGLAYGNMGSGERLYVASRNGNRIRVINPTDGTDVTLTTDFDLSSLSGGTFIMNDIGMSDDNVLFLGNLASSSFKLYLWTTEGGAPAGTYTFTLPTVTGIRYGDKFFVKGSWSDGTVEIWVPAGGTATDGKIEILKTVDQGTNWTIQEITMSGTYKNSVSSQHVAVLSDGSFYTSGNGANPRKHDNTGAYVASSLFSGTNSSQAANFVFTVGPKVYLLQNAYRANGTGSGNKNTRAQLWEVTDPTNLTLIGESNLLSENSTDFGNAVAGDLEVIVDSTGNATLFVLGTDQGLAAFQVKLSPTMDGTKESNYVWQNAKATADLTAGWANANAKNFYSTYDDKYLYLGTEIVASHWMSWCFIINSKTGGSSTDSWNRSITYSHSNLPDYDVRGNFNNGWTEFHSWNGSSWTGVGTNIGATEHSDNITGTDIDGFIEVRIPHSSLPEGVGDIQFFITGDQDTHGSFDAIPNDDNSIDWTDASTLTNYTLNVPLPVQLTSFTASAGKSGVVLNWSTATEVNNYGFEIERKVAEASGFEKIGFAQGHGNTNSPNDYTFTDADVTSGNYQYRLKQIDFDGTVSYSDVVEVAVNISLEKLSMNVYPNPFNPSTTLAFVLPKASRVNLSIYDITGQKVAELINNEVMEAGLHKYIFNASNLASGIYISVLQAEGIQVVKKLQLLK